MWHHLRNGCCDVHGWLQAPWPPPMKSNTGSSLTCTRPAARGVPPQQLLIGALLVVAVAGAVAVVVVVVVMHNVGLVAIC